MSKQSLLSFLKRPVPEDGEEKSVGGVKRQRGVEDKNVEPDESKKSDPSTICTWNADGLSIRLKKDWGELKNFIRNENLDVICIQEVRLPASGPPGCKKNDNARRKRGQIKTDTASDKEDRRLVASTLERLAAEMGYGLLWSLANYKYSGTAVLIKKTVARGQVTYNFPSEGALEHNEEGRIIVIEFGTFSLVNLYVPNNGVKPTSFLRRQKWDIVLSGFVKAHPRPLVIVGDLNVAHQDMDLSHPDFFKRRHHAEEPDNSGQPGCTPGERRRFSELIESGRGLCDTYRQLHPNGHGFTWRGQKGANFDGAGIFYGKGMRIDYALVSKTLIPRVKAVTIVGSGADRRGFMGSDHSPLILELQPDPSHVPPLGEASGAGAGAEGRSK